jgi:hypothetical protein
MMEEKRDGKGGDRRSVRHAIASAWAAFNTFRGDLQVTIIHDVTEENSWRKFRRRELFEG